MSCNLAWQRRITARNVAGVYADEPEALQVARRVRAALAYAGIEVKRSVDGITPATMARLVSLSNPRGFQRPGEPELIAQACHVPVDFLRHGFPHDDDELDGRLELIEEQLAELHRSILSLSVEQAAARPDASPSAPHRSASGGPPRAAR